MASLRIAAAQYPIDRLSDLASFEMKLSQWVAEAVDGGAKLLVFPEYGSMELASIFGDKIASDLARSIAAIQDLLPEVDALHAALARKHGIYILAASAPVRQIDGGFVNTARLFAPHGVGAQEKLVMTRFERETWKIAPGRGLRVFDTAIGRIGVSICYDAEFPLIVRTLAEAGAQMILVPSCTDTLAGYHRVRLACAARALENQCYVVQAPTVGAAPWSPAVDINIGAAGVFSTPDAGMPDDGVIATGRLDEPAWVFADLDLARIDAVRRAGQVLNFAHWRDQPGAPVLPRADVVKL